MWTSKVRGKAKAGFATMFVPAAAMVVLLFSAVGQVNAQTEQGRWMVGGGLSGNVATDSNPIQILGQNFTRSVTNFSFNLSPQAGYFVAPDLAVGVGLGFGVNHYVQTNGVVSLSPIGLSSFVTLARGTNTNTTWSMSLGPFVRYFFLSLAPTTKLFAQARVNLGIANRESTATAESFNQRSTDGTAIVQPVLTLGCAFFVTPSIAIEPSVSYERTFSWGGFGLQQNGSQLIQQTLRPITRSTGSLQYGVGFQIYF